MAPAFHHFPSDAVKAILVFMTREQLSQLTGVNRRFYSLINSPSFATKPLLRIWSMRVRHGHVVGTFRPMIHDAVMRIWRYCGAPCMHINGLDAIESFLEQKWLRINRESSAYRNCQLPELTVLSIFRP